MSLEVFAERAAKKQRNESRRAVYGKRTRQHWGVYIDERFRKRLEAVAEKQDTSASRVLEEILQHVAG